MKKKELKKRIKELEAKVQHLESRVSNLECSQYTYPAITWGETNDWKPPDVKITCSIVAPCM
jgi:uncharacterized coiled-coil protein SlyX